MATKKTAEAKKAEETKQEDQDAQTEQDAQEAAAADGTPQFTAESEQQDAKPKWYEETMGRCPHPDSYDVVERHSRGTARQVAQANESEAALQS